MVFLVVVVKSVAVVEKDGNQREEETPVRANLQCVEQYFEFLSKTEVVVVVGFEKMLLSLMDT